MVSESALPLDKGLDRAHDDNVRIRRHEVTMAAIIVKDRDRNRGSGLILVRTVSLVGNGGRRDAVCVFQSVDRHGKCPSFDVCSLCCGAGVFNPLHSCPYIAIVSPILNV